MGPSTLGAGDPCCSIHFIPPHLWPLTWELRCWSWRRGWGGDCRCLDARQPPRASPWPTATFPFLGRHLFGDPAAPSAPLLSASRAEQSRAVAACCRQPAAVSASAFLLLVVQESQVSDYMGRPPTAAGASATAPGHGQGVPAGNLSWGGPRRSHSLPSCSSSSPSPSLSLPRPLPPGGCLLSHVGWSWVVS